MISQTTKLQRFLSTEFILKKRLNVPAVWLKPEGDYPSAEDAVADSLTTDLGAWNDQNLGVRLIDGHLELRISSPDDVWARCLFEAYDCLNVDARASYGVRHVTSIILHVENPDTIDQWEHRWPRGHTDKSGQKISTRYVYSIQQSARSKTVWRTSAPLPGSMVNGQTVVWRPKGKPPADDPELGIEDLEARAIGKTSMEAICRGIAYATLLYWIRVYLDGLEEWDESLIKIIGGWIAKVTLEGAAINAHGKSLEGICWSPIDSAEHANALCKFLQKSAHASSQLGVALLHAQRILDRDPSAHVPGWSNLENALGLNAKMGIRRAFRAGIDLDMIENMAERYVLDVSSHRYLDRESLVQDVLYEHTRDDLINQWDNVAFFIGKKRHNPFRLYATSEFRSDVKRTEFYPGYEPGAVLRYSPVHGVIPGDADRLPDEYRILNIFPGFKIKPIATVDPAMMSTAVTMIDRVLSLLTEDNTAQIKWLKQFVAWIAQNPQIKPQVCPIIIGGQGIGKSLFGNNLMKALFGSMAGTADASLLSSNRFMITPFIGKLITFIDEVKIESHGAVNFIKKLIRQDDMSGEMKYAHQREYYIPSRVLIASNQVDIGLTPADAVDRAFFFVMAWTAKKKGMNDAEFLTWSLSLKPFYVSFVEMLGNVVFKQHLMRYFMEFEVTRAELEDLRYSSREDTDIVREFMSKTRTMAREMIADARILQHYDITAWFTLQNVREAIRRIENTRTPKIEASDVIAEFETAGVLETMHQGMYRFKYSYKKLCDKIGEAHGMTLVPFWPLKIGDTEDNDVLSPKGGPAWRGDNSKNYRDSADPRGYDPDRMEFDD